MTTHGMYRSKEYIGWKKIQRACCNPKHPQYKKYGGQGITMCEEWQTFSNFLRDIGNMPPNCNGLELRKGCTCFQKDTCSWVYKNKGRRKVPKELVLKKRTRLSTLKEPHPICLTIERKLAETIKRLAMHKSIEKGIFVEPNELIRDALMNAFPDISQYDIFAENHHAG